MKWFAILTALVCMFAAEHAQAQVFGRQQINVQANGAAVQVNRAGLFGRRVQVNVANRNAAVFAPAVKVQAFKVQRFQQPVFVQSYAQPFYAAPQVFVPQVQAVRGCAQFFSH